MRAVCVGLLVLGLLVVTGAIRAADETGVKAVIDKALKAMGGAEKVAKFKAASCKFKVTRDENGQQFTVEGEALWQGARQARLDAEVAEGGQTNKVGLVINGDKGWVKKGDEVQDAPEALLSTLKNAFYALRTPHQLPALKDAAFKLAPLGEQKINGKDAVGVSFSHKDHRNVSVFFDKESGLPVKSETRLSDPNGKEITIEYSYSEFKEMDGVKQPSKITLKADGKDFTIELSEIKAKDKVDDSEFAKP